ncbi:hypothetical protein EXU85_29945 [Spirosoma sp. KCTC 42546]|uniref:hypothetical protein n=1 Tax=Spirosoma sp. KCTC 42546 TaxID=2520506 RepID=UPI0011585272|nr:hypothetical protein [Spirosoma sp. KCTC 42546]QDK82607.1 hypothetical protein EXU85_29945 [Spirosoma sp. KCTC 42546]
MGRLIAGCVAFLFSFWLTSSSFYEAIAVSFSLYTFLTFIEQIGQRIAIPACICFIAALEILAVPAFTYWVLPASMPIESTAYFAYALPAYVAFYTGLSGFSTQTKAYTHQHYLQSAGKYLNDRRSAGIVLFTIGLSGFLAKTFIPVVPAFMGTLPMYCLLISALYAYCSGSPYRVLLIGFTLLALLINTVRTGMFSDLFFWLLFLLMFGAVHSTKLGTIQVKTILMGCGFAFLLLIQSIKAEYRYNTWGSQRNERMANVSLMVELLVDRFTYPEKLLNTRHFFASFGRFNQGIMIGSAMAKVPLHESYARGEVLLALIYPLIPRLLWSGKPQTGGYENIRRFTTLPQFENTSINLSPVGEGYVNFGYGGILFAGLYGLLLRACFQYVFNLANRIPSIILWLPMLYIGCLTMETDLLSTWGSLVNSALFIAFLFWSLKRTGIEL